MLKKRARTAEHKGLRREKILEVARQCFQESSLEDLKISHLAKRAGMAKGTVYLYFKTKEEIFLAVLTKEYEHWCDYVEAGIPGHPDLPALLVEGIKETPLLGPLVAVMHTNLETNINFEAAYTFKKLLKNRARKLTALIQKEYPQLRGKGLEYLMMFHSNLIGIHHMAHPTGVVDEVLGLPAFVMLKVSFHESLERTMRFILVGMTQE